VTSDKLYYQHKKENAVEGDKLLTKFTECYKK